jgi:hypothetical protein
MMINPIKKVTIASIITLAIIAIISSVLIFAWVTDAGSDSSNVTVGNITLELTGNPETNVTISLTSPTFLLYPQVIVLYNNEDFENPQYLNHLAQFQESCHRLTITLKNSGNVQGVIGYGSGASQQGIITTLIDNNLTNNRNDLAGISYVIVPHEDVEEYYTYLLNLLDANNQNLTYDDFSALSNTLALVSEQTINQIKSHVFEPNSQYQFDIFIWQEYYDGGHYISQYNANNSEIIKQEFSLKIEAYFGQTGIN